MLTSPTPRDIVIEIVHLGVFLAKLIVRTHRKLYVKNIALNSSKFQAQNLKKKSTRLWRAEKRKENRVEGKRAKRAKGYGLQSPRRGGNDPKPAAAVPVNRVVPVAIGATTAPGIVVPRTATQQSVSFITI